MRWKEREAYTACVADLLNDTAVQSMRLLPQHAPGVSCYHHSLLVSYASFRFCRFWGLDARAAARGGLLHDLYLYNWRDRPLRASLRHLFSHPAAAELLRLTRLLAGAEEIPLLPPAAAPAPRTRAG